MEGSGREDEEDRGVEVEAAERAELAGRGRASTHPLDVNADPAGVVMSCDLAEFGSSTPPRAARTTCSPMSPSGLLFDLTGPRPRNSSTMLASKPSRIGTVMFVRSSP